MENFFAADYLGAPFVLFGRPHLVALAALVALNLGLLRLKGSSEKTRSIARWTLAGILWANEIGWHVWHVAYGQWDLQTMLPLHLCSILVWLGGWMLVTESYSIYEYMYLLGIAGAIQALMTPDIGFYGFPHYRFFQTFISHGLIVTSAIYMTVVEGLRPTWSSTRRVFIGANIYMAAVGVVNWLVGSNYLMIAHKPETASLLDVLPPWPWYILWMEAIGLLSILLLYVPFALKDRGVRKLAS